jgi:adenine-specific DNA-methyltransferase
MQIGDVFEFSRGYIAYDAHRGHSKETIANRVFHANDKSSNEYKKELVGSDIGRYLLNVKSKLWIRFGDNLAAPRHPRFHTGTRIWIQRIRNPKLTQRLVCFFTDNHDDLAASSGLTIGRSIDPAYSVCALCGLLNSPLINWFYRQLYHDVNIKPTDIKTIPIPLAWLAIQPRMIELVNQTQIASKQLIEARTSHEQTLLQRQIEATDEQIDALVYELYGLTEEEIRIVEGT